MWRAIRYGLDGRLLDLEAPVIEEFAAAEALDRLNALGRQSTSCCRRSTAPSASGA